MKYNRICTKANCILIDNYTDKHHYTRNTLILYKVESYTVTRTMPHAAL